MGGLSNIPGPQLGIIATQGALKAYGVNPHDIDEVYYGNVVQAGLGQAPARQVALGSGLKEDTPCTTINKMCASGMKSVMLGATAISMGDRDTILSGGLENMSRCPHYLQLRKPTGYGHA
jgi:acetyl-CoA C-acetyltransferase